MYDNTNLGISYVYLSPANHGYVDVYRYPLSYGPLCTADCARNAIKGELEEFERQIPALIQAHKWDSINVVSADKPKPAAGSWLEAGRHIRLRVFRSGSWNRSDYWLFAGLGTLLKVRTTYPEDQDPAVYKAMVSELLTSAGAPYSCPRGVGEGQMIQVSNKEVGDYQKMAREIDRALHDLRYPTGYRDAEQGVWSSGPRFQPLIAQGQREASDAGVAVVVQLDEVNDSLALQVSSRTLCQSNDPNASVLATTAAMELVNKIHGR